MLSLFLLAATQSTDTFPHAAIHPPEAVSLAAFHDLSASGTAYADAPLFRFLRDDRILELLSNATGETLDPSLLAPGPLFSLLLDQLPPEAQAMGIEEILRDARKVSGSMTVAEDFEEVFSGLLRSVWTLAELDQLAEALRGVQVENGPDALRQAFPDDESITLDAWGRPYTFESVADIGFVIRSLGADNQVGGVGADIDLSASLYGPDQPSPLLIEPMIESIGLQMAVEFGSEVGADRMLSLARMAALELAEDLESDPFSLDAGAGALEGLRFRVDAEGVQIDFWVGAQDSIVVFGFGSVTPEDTAVRLGAAGAVPRTVAAGLESLPEREGTPIFTGYERRTPLAIYELGLDLAMATGGAEVLARLTEGAVSAEQLSRLTARIELDQRRRLKRQVLVDSTFHTDTLRPGPSAPAERLAADDFSTVHPDAALVFAGELPLAAAYDLLLEVGAGLQGVDPEDYHAQGVELLGLDLRDDLFAQFDSHCAISMEPIGALGLPKLMFHTKVGDPERVSTSLNTIVESVAAAFPDEFEAQTRSYREMPLARLALKGIDLPISVEPSFGLVGDRLLFGLTGTQVKKELRRLGKGGATPHPLVASPRVGLDRDLHSVTYFDWPTFAQSAYDTGRALAGLGGGLPPEVPISLEDLPDGEIFTEYFEPTIVTVREIPAGRHTHTTASFGPEFSALIQGASLASQALTEDSPSWGGTLRAAPVAREAAPVDPVAETNAAMNRVRVALQVYFYEHDSSYPADLAGLSAPPDNFPQGALDGDALPDDGWAHALRYAVDADGAGYRLWSVGPNGLDEDGEADDIEVTVR